MIDMEEKSEIIFNLYKKYIEENSMYKPRVVKYFNNQATYFPIITFTLSDNKDTTHNSLLNIDYFESFYFTINIFCKEEIVDTTKTTINEDGEEIEEIESKVVPASIIDKELERLTNEFFRIYNIRKTSNKPIPNIQANILRRTIQFQCEMGVRSNIIRR